MKLRPYLIQILVAVLMLVCSNLFAQDNRGDAKLLEQGLENLNDLIEDEPSRYHHDRAEILFRLGRFEESVRDYTVATQYAWPHSEDSCWERGLAQYYAGDFNAGAEQFARYHRIGALDIENGLWRLLCIAEDKDIEKARATMLSYSRRVRVPFPALLELYLGNGNAEAVLKQATTDITNPQERTANLFNAHYYLAKYYELIDDNDRALHHIQEALKHQIPHFMYACAQIDAERIKSRQNSSIEKK